MPHVIIQTSTHQFFYLFIDFPVDRQMDGWMDGWMDGRINEQSLDEQMNK